MVVKVGSVRSQALVKSAESLSVSVTADQGFWIPPQLDMVQPVFCIWPASPKAGGRYGSEGEPVWRKGPKKRREVITSSHWVLKIPPPLRFITGALLWRQNVGHLERKEQECFGGIWHLQIPALAREARLKAHTPCFWVAVQRSVETGWLLGLPIVCTFSYVPQAVSHH